MLHRAGAASLSLLYFITHCTLAGAAERNFYDELRRVHPTTTVASLPTPSFFSVPVASSSRLSELPPLPALLEKLPASLGTLRGMTGNPAGAAVIYVQDVHRNEEAQRRIGAAVRDLIDGGVTLVALEGASGPINLSPFRESPFLDSAHRAVDGLLADGKISGAAFGAMTASREARVVGVEDAALYDANVRAVRSAALVEGDARRRLAEQRR